MPEYKLEELNASNIVAANSLTVKPGQEHFVAPPSYSMAEAFINPATAWPRVVVDGDRVVGFVRGNFDPANPHEEFRSCLWRINVDADYQGKGVGAFAIAALVAEAKARGNDRLNVMWESGSAGPEEFFKRMGFEQVGTSQYGEVIGEIKI